MSYYLLYTAVECEFVNCKRMEHNSRERSFGNLQIANGTEGNGIIDPDCNFTYKVVQTQQSFVSFSPDHRINYVFGTDFILIRLYSVIHFSFSKGYVRRKASLLCIIRQVRVIRQTSAISEPVKQQFSRLLSFCRKILCDISFKLGPDNEVQKLFFLTVSSIKSFVFSLLLSYKSDTVDNPSFLASPNL